MHSCIVCKSDNIGILYAGLFKCEECGHVFAALDMDNKSVGELYGKSYFFGEEYKDYVADKEVLARNFAMRFDTLKKYLSPEQHQRLLEIGSAYGFFLNFIRNSFTASLGIDVAEEGVRYAREQLHLNVVHGDFLQFDFADQEFDVVCLWDTIEHLCDPQLYIEKISRLTRSGSLIAITTGDISSIIASLKREKWRLIHPPTHIHYFSKESLTRLLNSYGFDVVYNKYCGFFRSNDNILHNVFVIRKKKDWIYRSLKRMRLTRGTFYLNLYDIMYVIARRR